nr:unnamed protein product [Digitaria exilis]
MAGVGENVESSAGVVHGGRHGVGVEPEVDVVVPPRAAPGVEHLDGRAAWQPAGEADHLVGSNASTESSVLFPVGAGSVAHRRVVGFTTWNSMGRDA